MSTTVPTALEELRSKSALAIRLQNCSDEVQETQWNGHFYRFEPGQILEIVDQKKHQVARKGAQEVVLFKAPLITPETWDASRVAQHVLEKLESRGVTALLDDGNDPLRIRQAKASYLRYRVERAKRVRQEWLAKVAMATQEPGSVPPPQPDEVRAEFRWLETYERGLVDRKRYVSKIDSFETDDRDQIMTYHRKHYPDQVVEHPEAYIIDTHANLPEKPTRKERAVHEAEAAPPINTLPEIQQLIDRAEEFHVRLTAKELKGLARQDEDTVSAVLAKVALAASSKKSRERREETHDESQEGGQETEADGEA